MTEDQKNKWDELIAKINEADATDPIHEELRKQIIEFLNKELLNGK